MNATDRCVYFVLARQVMKIARKLVSATDEYDGDKFFTKVDGVRRATPMLVVLICIELSDVLFAVDSIPAVVGITQVRSRTQCTAHNTLCYAAVTAAPLCIVMPTGSVHRLLVEYLRVDGVAVALPHPREECTAIVVSTPRGRYHPRLCRI